MSTILRSVSLYADSSVRVGLAGVLVFVLGANCVPDMTDGDGDTGLPAEVQRVAFQSQCAQNVIECTSSWPTAVASVIAGPGQAVSETETGFRIEGGGDDGAELVNLVGDESERGDGAEEIFYSWSSGAADENPQTLAPGTEFSTEANPTQRMQVGFHYIRLTIENDIPREDFIEIEIEIVE